jgi:hypothetical protein
VREHRYFTYIYLLGLSVFATSCVAKPGNIRSLIDLPGPKRQPSRPEAPSQPEKFPAVSLVWERTQDQEPAVAWNLKTSPKRNVKGQHKSVDAGSHQLNHPEPLLEAPRTRAAVGRNIGPFWLPPVPQGATERAFDQDLHQALTILVNKGRNPSARLATLKNRLLRHPKLENLRKLWLPTIETAQEYGRVTIALREPLSILKRAFRKARFDEYYGVYRDIDLASCRWATRRSIELLPASQDDTFEVVVKGLGRHSLASVATLCEQALAVELSEREFPKIKGRRNLRRLVQKAYEKENPQHKVYQTSVPGAWQSDGGGFLLRAVMGIERKSNFPHTQCTIEEVELSARKKRNQQNPECCEIVRSLAIECERLR